MHDPLSALLVAGAIAVLMAVLFWPHSGLVARWQRMRLTSRRVLMEDALKHLYDCEYRRIVCTRLSLAGALGAGGEETARVLQRLASLGLVLARDEGYVLTGEGRSYALRVIRTHRLWERYLADETGVGEVEWHEDAERREHLLTSDEADALSARMGNPRYDPHGDPIPTPAGDLPGKRGIPLAQLAAGGAAEVIHVEDEPAAVYALLVARNLHPGLRLRVLESSRERVRFEAEGAEGELPPVAAANVTVLPLPEEPAVELPRETLAALRDGESARVLGISRRCRGGQRRRLLDLGLVPGTLVHAGMTGALGDPTVYTVRGAHIALRRAQAALIHVRREDEGRHHGD